MKSPENIPTIFDRETVLQLISDIHEQSGLSENAFEKLAGVSKDTIRDFKRGKSQMLRVDKFQKLLMAVGYKLIITRN